MKWFYRNIFIVIMSIICVSNTNAQTDSTAENFEVEVLSFEELMAMTVTSSSKTEQTISEAPSTMTAIAKEQIANFGWRSINDILYKQPGFGPSQDYDRKTVAGRGYFEGWNNNHLLFLIDGIPVNDNIYGTAYTSE
ncbi:MAG: TonB-dependent receptor plug domain-containing protein, partial [Methanococcaceae archaeon]